MRITWQGICLWAAVLLAFADAAHAQTVTPEDEYKKLIRVNEEVQPLGATPFGESVSLYNGSLSFEQTDISLAGNGPLLQLSRSYHLREAKESESIDGAFSDWDIEIPRITTMTAQQTNVTGWQINEPNSTARCTLFGPPPTVAAQVGGADWEPTTWWTGYQLIVPGSGSQDMLKRAAANTLSPSMGTATFPIVTRQNWMISCGVQTDDGVSGEGFTAVSPDGTTYTFNHLVYRWAPSMTRPYGSNPMSLQASGVQTMAALDDLLHRRQASMLVTHVEDRFGNYLNYTYDGANLKSITANDGRTLNLTYVTGTSRISTATLQSSNGDRTWSYDYGTDVYHVLNKVTLPDGKFWSFDMADFLASDMDPAGGTCSTAAQLSTDTWTGSITHPSGLVGSFQVKGMVHGRSYVPRTCHGSGDDAPGSTAAIPRVYYQLTLLQKTFSGAGLPAKGRTWKYSYSPPNESWTADACASNQSCASTVWTDVLDPDGHDVRYTFSNRFDVTEGQLLATDFYSGAAGSTLLRSEDNDYAAIPATGPWPWPWPESYGSVVQTRMNRAQIQVLAPQVLRTISQDGDTYTWQAEAFNAYAQVTQTKRCNSFSVRCDHPSDHPLEEATTYRNDTDLWVLGLPLQVTNITDNINEVESSNTYNTSDDTLLTRARFGQTLMSYTFNSAGQLASFTDGNSHTTTLGNYKRGIPQAIGYPDGTGETLVVDDFGQIGKITDQAGHATSYSYDPVGRLTGISYPSGDETAWLPKTFAYDFVTSAERGVPANHWRRTTTTGNAKTVMYFDAMLRPVLSDSAIGSAVQVSTLTTYNFKGQKVFSTYPSPTALTFSLNPTVDGSTTAYDALGRVTQVAQDSELGTLTSSTAYLSGARQQVTDPKGNVTTTSYQVFDSPSYDAVTKVQAPTGITQTIARDLYGNPLSITQSGLYGATETDTVTKTLTYDPYHRLCRTTEPESRSEVMGYDGANNLVWSASGATLDDDGSCHPELAQSSSVTTRTYDAMNRLKTIQPPAGTQNTSYDYDLVGRMTCAVTAGTCSPISGASIWRGTYNYRGMLTGESLQVTGQDAWGLGYAHDPNGSLSVIHYPDGEDVSYAPDALGRATRVGGYASGIAYFPNGAVASFAYGSGLSYVAEQNTRQQLSNLSYGQGSTLDFSEDLSYDKNGNITTVADLADGPRNKAFSYDALNRLTGATAAGLWGTEAYAYDALNNLRSRTSGGQTFAYNYDATNKLASITNGSATVSSYVYDNRGNVINNNGTNLVFDQKNQLTRIQGYDDYAYDAAGRRVMKTPTGGGAPTYYFYNHAGQLMYQYEPTSNKATSFIYLGSKMVALNSLLLMVPDAPASISVPGSSSGSYTVSWGGSANAASYVLEQSVDGRAWISAYQGSSLSQAMQQTANGSYAYRVKACNVVGCSSYRTSTPVVVTLPPTAAPTLSAPASNSTGTYTVSWTGVAEAATYLLEEQVDGGSWTTQQNTGATSETFADKGNGSYVYRVRVSNAGGAGPLSATRTVVVGRIPAAPPAPHISASGPDWKPVFALTWSAMPWATRYEAMETTTSDANTFYNGPDTSASIVILDEEPVSFEVRACSTYGCSAWSASTGHGGSAPTGIATLSVPANSSNGSYTVSWTSVGTATSYTLQEQVNGGSWTSVQNSAASSKAISGKANGSYGYRVEACNANGCGQWSATKTIVVGLIPAAPPAPHITVSGPDWKPVFAVTWSAMQWATRYEAMETTASGANTFYNGPNTSASVVILDEGAVSFKVRACSAAGCSAWSASTGHGGAAPTGIATLSVPATSSTGSYTVSWTSVSTATAYTLQEQVNGGSWTSVQNSAAISRAISGKTSASYGYRVEACNANGCGQWSSTKTIAVGVIPAVPATPTVHASGPSNKPVVTVSWSAVAGATSYTVEKTDPGSSVGDTFYSGPNTSASSLVFATGSVKFRVKACNATGCSGWSGYGSVTLHSDFDLMTTAEASSTQEVSDE